MVDLNPVTLIITLNINNLSNLIKKPACQDGLKKQKWVVYTKIT